MKAKLEADIGDELAAGFQTTKFDLEGAFAEERVI